MIIRPRRLRKSTVLRDMVAESRVSKEMLVYPYFVCHGTSKKNPIASMPGIFQLSVDLLLADVESSLKKGLNKVLLFGVGEQKSEDGSSSYGDGSIVPKAVEALKNNFGNDLFVITDVCVCGYTTHGHCGIIEHGDVANDKTLLILDEMAAAHARAGADMVAPSDMMDGRILSMRQKLDSEGLVNTGIMSYSIKYASSYYGPFRDAADSTPSFGDRRSYQMDSRNRREALKEARIDEQEGADILMVKPALAYLDIIRELKNDTLLPVAAYNVSGEYSMVKAAAEKGWIDERKIVLENMTSFARAGADIIITYHSKDLVEKGWL